MIWIRKESGSMIMAWRRLKHHVFGSVLVSDSNYEEFVFKHMENALSNILCQPHPHIYKNSFLR